MHINTWLRIGTVSMASLLSIPLATFAASSMSTITIGQALHFSKSDGTSVHLAPGTYEVKPGASTDQPTLVFTGDASTLQVAADLLQHEGELTVPRALVLPETEEIRRIVLLLPKGEGLEASGVVGKVRTRGIRRRTFKASPVRQALGSLRTRVPKTRVPKPSSPSTSGPLPALKSPVPDKLGLPHAGPPRPKVKRKSVGELLNILRTFSHGRQQIQGAIKQGVRLSLWQKEDETGVLSWLNPFPVSSAFAQEQFSVALNPLNMKVSGLAELRMDGISVRESSWFYLNGGYKQYNHTGFHVNVPTTNWYIVNVEASTGSGQPVYTAKLEHMENSKTEVLWPQKVADWSYPRNPDPGLIGRSFPALLHLEQGWHYFGFKVTAGQMLFHEMSIVALD